MIYGNELLHAPLLPSLSIFHRHSLIQNVLVVSVQVQYPQIKDSNLVYIVSVEDVTRHILNCSLTLDEMLQRAELHAILGVSLGFLLHIVTSTLGGRGVLASSTVLLRLLDLLFNIYRLYQRIHNVIVGIRGHC